MSNTVAPSDDSPVEADLRRDASESQDNACLANLRIADSNVVQAVTKALRDNSDADVKEASNILRKGTTLPLEDRQQLLEYLLDDGSHSAARTRLLHDFLSRQDARPALVVQLQRDAAVTTSIIALAMPESQRILTDCLLDKPAWPSTAVRNSTISTVVKSCLKLLMQALESIDPVLDTLVRLLSVQGEAVIAELSTETADGLLCLLDIRRSKSEQSKALLILMRLLDQSREKHTVLIKSLLIRKGSSMKSGDMIVAFAAAAALFPVMPAVCMELLVHGQVLTHVFSQLSPSAGMVSADIDEDLILRKAALYLLSASCIEKTCCEAIVKDGSSKVKGLLDDHDATCASLARLVCIKSGIIESDPGVIDQLSRTILQDKHNSTIAFEALAYASLHSRNKESIVANEALLTRVVAAIEREEPSLFSSLSIVVNLTMFSIKQSKEDQKLAQLKAYAEARKSQAEEQLETDAAVQRRCQKVIEAGTVPNIIARCKTTVSLAISSLVTKTLFALSRLPKERARMVQQGAIGTLLRNRELAGRGTETQATQDISILAAHAVARLLISVNPAHALSGAVLPAAAIAALSTLLVPSPHSGQRDWLPTFEGLLAMTNVASVDDDTVRQLIISSSWMVLETDLLLASNKMVQRASVELLCNLMQSPAAVQKFADGSDAASRRLNVLLILTDVDDLATRRGAGGALAMLTGWEGISDRVLEQPKGISLLLRLASDQDTDCRHRGLVCIMNLLAAPGNAGRKAGAEIKQQNGREILNNVSNTGNAELDALSQDLIKQLF